MILKLLTSILLHEISIWYNRKIELNIWYRNLCLQLQRSDVSCSSWPGLHTLQQGFWSTPPYRSFPDLSGFEAVAGQHRVSAPSIDFLLGSGSGDWLGHSRTLKCFLRSHSLVALAVCLRSLSCWKTQPWPICNALTEGRRLLGKISRYIAPYGAVVLSPLQKSTPKAWCFHPHTSRLGWCSWDCTNPSSSSKHGKRSLYQKVLFWSHLTTWPSPMAPLDHPDGLWQTSEGPGHVLAWAGGHCTCCRILIHDGVVCY